MEIQITENGTQKTIALETIEQVESAYLEFEKKHSSKIRETEEGTFTEIAVVWDRVSFEDGKVVDFGNGATIQASDDCLAHGKFMTERVG